MNNIDNPLFYRGYEELAAAIIGQAIHDYVTSGHYLHNHEKPAETKGKQAVTYDNHLRNYSQAKTFFESEQFVIYSNGNPELKDYLLDKMNKLTNLGKKEVIRGEEHNINSVLLNTGISLLCQRVADVVVTSA